jgi:hypothetical protein
MFVFSSERRLIVHLSHEKGNPRAANAEHCHPEIPRKTVTAALNHHFTSTQAPLINILSPGHEHKYAISPLNSARFDNKSINNPLAALQ